VPLTKRQVIDRLREKGLHLNKKLGQNYLIDGNVAKKIVGMSGVGAGDSVIEIGAGLGALTGLLAEKAEAVFAIEIDRGICEELRDIVSGFGNVEVMHADFLKFDIAGLPRPQSGARFKIVANLPYNITTPVIGKLIKNRGIIEYMVLMVQDEVAKRFLARPGDDDYSSVTVFMRFYTGMRRLMKVKRTNFFPEPDVDSAVLEFDILDKPPVDVKDEDFFIGVVRRSFGNRRKMLINALCGGGGFDKRSVEAALKDADIPVAARAEDVGMEAFAGLSNILIDSAKGDR